MDVANKETMKDQEDQKEAFVQKLRGNEPSHEAKW